MDGIADASGPHARHREALARIWAPAVAVVTAAVIAGPLPGFVPDSEYYLRMAEGGSVPAPFSGRIAYPGAVHLLSLLGLNITLGFAVLGALSLLLFCAGVARLLAHEPPTAIALTLATPVLVFSFDASFLPDLAFAAVIALVFLVIRSRRDADWTPLLLLAPFLVRETAALFGIVLAVVAWRRRRRRLATVALATTAVGYAVSSWIGTAGGQTTMHGVGGPLYLVAKAPYNVMKNVLGLEVATNDLNRCGAELHQLPRAFGNIVAAGLCPFDATMPLITAGILLTTFGVAPAVLVALLWRRPRTDRREVWEQALLWSGVISFVLAPALGASVGRLATYGWPAFTVIVPVLLGRYLSRMDLLRALGASLVVAWGAYLLGSVLHGLVGAVVIVVVGVLCQVLAYRWTARRFDPAEPTYTGAPEASVHTEPSDQIGRRSVTS